MKSNRDNTAQPLKRSDLYQILSREKELLVTMFLSSASHNELSEQIKKIDELCTRIDNRQHKQAPH
jgi:hypothetical protein